MCEVPSEVQQSKVTRQLPLHSNQHKSKAHSKGSLDFVIWLGPTNDVLGRMDEGMHLLLAMYALLSNVCVACPCFGHTANSHICVR